MALKFRSSVEGCVMEIEQRDGLILIYNLPT